jgi:hypothetical protein
MAQSRVVQIPSGHLHGRFLSQISFSIELAVKEYIAWNSFIARDVKVEVPQVTRKKSTILKSRTRTISKQTSTLVHLIITVPVWAFKS